MREILFRGKRVDNGEWETGYFVRVRMGCSDERAFITDKMTGYLTPVCLDTVCQYTGLKDKDGRKIWENDILKSIDYFTPKTRYSKVVFKYYGAWTSDNIRSANDVLYLADVCGGHWKSTEIIGNVFDNPELLEDKI